MTGHKQFELVMTTPHKQLLETMLPLMEAMYNNDLTPILLQVAQEYHTLPETAENMAKLIRNLDITDKNEKQAMQTHNLITACRQDMVHAVSGEPMTDVLQLTDEERKALAKILDTFSRILMGQLSVIFEALDVRVESEPIQEYRLQAWHDAYWEGGLGLQKARADLIPETAEFGWNGGYGICSNQVSEKSRLAYEMQKVLNFAKPLKVTEIPLPHLEAIKYRVAP